VGIVLAAKELGLVEQTLRNGVKAAAAGKLTAPGTKPVTPEQRELSRLRAQNAQLKMHVDIKSDGALCERCAVKHAWIDAQRRELQGRGHRIGLRRLERLMRGTVFARHKRRFKATTDSKPSMPVAPNLVARNFMPEARCCAGRSIRVHRGVLQRESPPLHAGLQLAGSVPRGGDQQASRSAIHGGIRATRWKVKFDGHLIFAAGIFHLQAKRGPVQWQLPPHLKYDESRMRACFALLPRDTRAALTLARKRDYRRKGRVRLAIDANRPVRHAVEIRHESFLTESFVRLLRERNIALVIAATAQRWSFVHDITADFVYLRLHGDVTLYQSGYSDVALEH
jgi:transposase-like protein